MRKSEYIEDLFISNEQDVQFSKKSKSKTVDQPANHLEHLFDLREDKPIKQRTMAPRFYEEEKKLPSPTALKSGKIDYGEDGGDGIEKRGWLRKQSPALLKKWQKRYFVLYNRKFAYYKTDLDTKMKGVINFDFVSVEVVKNTKNKFNLKLLGSKRVFKLKADTEAESKEWIKAIKSHIEKSIGNQKSISIPEGSKYWKYDRITESSFLQICMSGDILLFQTHSFHSKLQRKLTISKYDHVALLIKFQDKGLFILEATSEDGVNYSSWSEFKDYYEKAYKKVVYRKLTCKRDAEMMGKLEKFVSKSYGHKYGLGAKKLFGKSKTLKEGKDAADIKEDRTFFCSELVAKAYKSMGILETQKSSAKYWPADFSTEKDLQLVQGISLSDELLIEFIN